MTFEVCKIRCDIFDENQLFKFSFWKSLREVKVCQIVTNCELTFAKIFEIDFFSFFLSFSELCNEGIYSRGHNRINKNEKKFTYY